MADQRQRQFVFAAACCLVGMAVLIMLGQGSSKPDVTTRLDELEAAISALTSRVEKLEAKDGETAAKPDTKKPVSAPVNVAGQARGQIFDVTITNKRFQESDFRKGIYEDAIYWDTELKAASLKRPTRAVKGQIVFSDLFDEVKIRIGWTINDPIRPGGSILQQGRGIDYNQFLDSHNWLRTTQIKDMKVKFVVDQIIYEDGTTEEVGD